MTTEGQPVREYAYEYWTVPDVRSQCCYAIVQQRVDFESLTFPITCSVCGAELGSPGVEDLPEVSTSDFKSCKMIPPYSMALSDVASDWRIIGDALAAVRRVVGRLGRVVGRR